MEQARQAGNWCADNFSRIQQALSRLDAKGRDAEHAQRPPFAVFDFDNTCIFRDIGQAMFRVQLLELHYRIDPATLATLLPAQGVSLGGKPWQLLRGAILHHYQELWPLLQAGQHEEARGKPAYRHFTTLLTWFIGKARSVPELGPCYILSLLAKLQAGHSLGELRAFCTQVLRQVQQEPLSVRQLHTQLPEPLGEISAQYPTGLQPFAEMRELMALLQGHGLRCYVVSASSEWLVKTAAARLAFPLAEDDIFGVRTQMAAGDVVLPEAAKGHPLTYRSGKNEVIDRYIGGTPWLTAGDADTDYDMLTRPGVTLRLLINRQLSGLIAELYQHPDILLQGIDQRSGRFRPSRESVGP